MRPTQECYRRNFPELSLLSHTISYLVHCPLFITSISILLLCDTHRVKSKSYFRSRGVPDIINTGQHSITTLTAPFSLPFPFIFGITAAQCPISWSVSWQVPQCPHICASPQPDLMHRTFHLRPNFSLLTI